jgi:membrane-bound serine protease (ClpP class)
MLGIELSWLDPNLVYILLVAGLWLGVLAMYIPGTGFAELLALGLILASLFILSMMPTNWMALAILVLGVSSFLLLPFFGESWGRYAVLGLLLQGVGGYYLFPQTPVSILLIGVSLLFGLGYYYKVLVPVLATQNEKREDEIIIGSQGRVVKDLDPVGTVYVKKELWRARSEETLAKDTLVVVVAQDGLELLVEKAKHSIS